MTKLEINHNGEIANIDAVKAVLHAMQEKAWDKNKSHKFEMFRYIDGLAIKVKVMDQTSEEMYHAGCSSVFQVENMGEA